MRSLQHFAIRWVRHVLTVFGMALAVAIVSPMIHAPDLQVVCSASGGVKLIELGEDGEVKSGHTLDCPLCTMMSAPPPAHSDYLKHASPLAFVLRPIAAARLAAHTAPPLPSRGPPSLS